MNEVTKIDAPAAEVWGGPAALQAQTPMDMLSIAVSRGASIEVLEKLMALAERQEANQARRAFDKAMAAAKAEMPTITKNRHVGFESRKPGAAKTDYHHEDLAEIVRTITPVLGKYGLSFRFRTTSEVGQPITVTCKISHEDGHCEENTLIAGRDESGNKNSIQAIGSTVTYLQRYTLKAALGLAASNDDDGRSSEAPDPIESEQFGVIRKLIIEAGTDEEKFCALFKIGALAELPAAKFEKAVGELQAAIDWQRNNKKAAPHG